MYFRLQTTASEATFVALLAARSETIKKYRTMDSELSDSEINARLVGYCSDQVSIYRCICLSLSGFPSPLCLCVRVCLCLSVSLVLALLKCLLSLTFSLTIFSLVLSHASLRCTLVLVTVVLLGLRHTLVFEVAKYLFSVYHTFVFCTL